MVMHTPEEPEEEGAIAVAINDEEVVPEEERLIEPVAEVEAAEDIALGLRANLSQPIAMTDNHPAPDGYGSRFLGFAKFRRNFAKNANY